MLVLTRKLGESIKIGDNIEVRIIGISGNRVRLGLVGPDNVTFLRKELCEGETKTKDISEKEQE